MKRTWRFDWFSLVKAGPPIYAGSGGVYLNGRGESNKAREKRRKKEPAKSRSI